jgi:hypothetical protein
MPNQESDTNLYSDESSDSENDYVSIAQALKLIPKCFDGSKSELREFLANVETALAVVNPDKHAIFLKFIESRITGEAKTKLLARADRTWNRIKQILEENYAVRRTIEFFACRLFNSKQGPSETVATWGSRIDTMSSDLTEAMIRLLPERHHEGAIAFLKYITKACFIQGSHDEKIQTVVRARDEKMLLPNAVEVALEEESAILSGIYKKNAMPKNQFQFAKKETDNYRTNDPRKDRKDKKPFRVHKICYKCQKEGHVAAECRNTPKCKKCSRWRHETSNCRSQERQGDGL